MINYIYLFIHYLWSGIVYVRFLINKLFPTNCVGCHKPSYLPIFTLLLPYRRTVLHEYLSRVLGYPIGWAYENTFLYITLPYMNNYPVDITMFWDVQKGSFSNIVLYIQ